MLRKIFSLLLLTLIYLQAQVFAGEVGSKPLCFDDDYPCVDQEKEVVRDALLNREFGDSIADTLADFPPDQAETYCLAPETKVWTVDGLSPIKALDVGSVVYCFNQDDTLTTSAVTEIFRHQVDKYVAIDIEGKLVQSTVDHRFYLENGRQICAQYLQVGNRLLGVDGQSYPVTAICTRGGLLDVVNLHVAKYNNFFICPDQQAQTVDEQTPLVCVHNCKSDIESAKAMTKLAAGLVGITPAGKGASVTTKIAKRMAKNPANAVKLDKRLASLQQLGDEPKKIVDKTDLGK